MRITFSDGRTTSGISQREGPLATEYDAQTERLTPFIFLFQIQNQILSGSNCPNLLSNLVSTLVSEHGSLQPEVFAQRGDAACLAARINGVCPKSVASPILHRLYS